MNDILVVPPVGTAPAIGITDEGERIKGQLMASSLTIAEIISIPSRDLAITVAGRIKAHLKEVESNRQEVLKPFHATTSAINQAAKTHIAQLEVELRRINGIVGAFEVQRQKEEFMERERIAAEAKQAEEAVTAAPASLEAQLDAEDKQQDLAGKLEASIAMQQAARPHGGALRQDWDITVTELKALYAAHPQCVKLTANLLSIKDLLKAGITPPGVTALPKVAYSARATR